MSDRERTPQEYIQRHADMYCNGDVEMAAGQAIVKEVVKSLEEDGDG